MATAAVIFLVREVLKCTKNRRITLVSVLMIIGLCIIFGIACGVIRSLGIPQQVSNPIKTPCWIFPSLTGFSQIDQLQP
jgi:hypothetical protein